MPFPVRSEGGADPADIADADQDDPLAPESCSPLLRVRGYEKLRLLAVLGQERASLRHGAACQRSPVASARLVLTVSSSTEPDITRRPPIDMRKPHKSRQPLLRVQEEWRGTGDLPSGSGACAGGWFPSPATAWPL